MNNKKKEDEYSHQKENVQLIPKGVISAKGYEVLGIVFGVLIFAAVTLFVVLYLVDKHKEKEQDFNG